MSDGHTATWPRLEGAMLSQMKGTSRKRMQTVGVTSRTFCSRQSHSIMMESRATVARLLQVGRGCDHAGRAQASFLRG